MSGLVGAVLTGGTIYVAVIRSQLTKADHADICEGKQTLVFQALDHINEKLDKQDKKLDRLLFNGGG